MDTLYMLSAFDSILLGFVQGMTEFLPISSSGHLILTRQILGIDQAGGLAFDAILQLATALAVVVYFRKDIFDLVLNLFKKVKDPEKTNMVYYLIVGSVPAVVAGLYLQDYMDSVFRSPNLVALTLIIGALIMFAADKFLERRKEDITRANDLTIKKSFGIGIFQALALVPGMSRSGMSISGGYFLGLTKELAIKFSFLLSIPIITGAGIVKLWGIVQEPTLINGSLTTLLFGAISAFLFGWLAIDLLLKYLKTHSFTGFVVYRVVLAGAILLFFM